MRAIRSGLGVQSDAAKSVEAVNAPARSSAENVADPELIERILGGDAEAFRTLIERHHPKVFRLVQGILQDWHYAEDVCQDIYTTVHRKLPGFRNQSLFSTWLYRVAVNAAIKGRRRWRRYNPRPLEIVGDVADRPADDPDFEGREVFTQLLRPLPEKLRVVVVLREMNGLSYDEIASVLHCSRGAVEQRLHRAMTRLRSVWTDARPVLFEGARPGSQLRELKRAVR